MRIVQHRAQKIQYMQMLVIQRLNVFPNITFGIYQWCGNNAVHGKYEDYSFFDNVQ